MITYNSNINMSLTKPDYKKIKEEIKNYDGKSYNKEQLYTVILDILQNNINESDNSKEKEIFQYIVEHVYCHPESGDYYFNYKRKHNKHTKYHLDILNFMDNNKLTEKFNNLKITLDEDTKNLEVKFEEQIVIPIKTHYTYPQNFPYKCTKRTAEEFGPFGTQWYHELQYDDEIDEQAKKMEKQFDILRAIVSPEQRSPQWYELRDNKITASDGGTVIDENPYENQYKFILKKTIGLPFLSNEFVHHGKKYEEIATMIYEYRMNVSTDEFGLIGHPKYSFLGASPDRICNKFKLNGKNKSKYIGRMLEIKCPYVRQIKTTGEIIDNICPKYYWIQVQLQLECCDLEECDFWQCELREYPSRDEFIEDTLPEEPFRSKTTKFEKGCVIQLLPKKRMNDIIDGKYKNVVEDDSMYIYPPRIEMTPYDYDIWIMSTLSQIQFNPKYKDYFFDKVIYWKLVKSGNVTILRDREWFAKNLPKFEQMWNYVTFFRNNKDKLQILKDYIDSQIKKNNKDIMNVVSQLYNTNDVNYNTIVDKVIDNQKAAKIKKDIKDNNKNDNSYMFVDTDNTKKSYYKSNNYTYKSKPKTQNTTNMNNDIESDADYMFIN